MLTEAAFLSVLAAAVRGPAVDLRWPEATCPDRRQMVRALTAIGVDADARAPQTTVVAERSGGMWHLVLTSGPRRALREVQQLDSCDAEAATMAAVVERFARPVWLWLEKQRAEAAPRPPVPAASAALTNSAPAPAPAVLPPLDEGS